MDPLETQLAQLAVAVLLSIGVTADPPPPSSGRESLQFGQLGAEWVDGAVAPVTLRAMAGALLMELPAEARRMIGEAFVASANAANDDFHSRFGTMLHLMTHPNSSLDSIPNRPLVGINIHAPQRAIVAAIEELVRKWKDQEGITEHRRRNELFDDYLRAWDLREGWISDHYEADKELPFHEIAKRTGVPTRTAASRYFSAFGWITGHQYSLDKWVLLFAVAKLATRFGNHSLRRRRSHSRRGSRPAKPVVESVLRPNSEGPSGFLASFAGPDQQDAFSDSLDVTELIAGGWTDERIIEEMQFEDLEKGLELIQYLREHHSNAKP